MEHQKPQPIVYKIGDPSPGLQIAKTGPRQFVLEAGAVFEMPKGFIPFCRRFLGTTGWPPCIEDTGDDNFLTVYKSFSFDGASTPKVAEIAVGDPEQVTEEALRHDIVYRCLRYVWAELKKRGLRARLFLKTAWYRRRGDWAFLADIRANRRKVKAAMYYLGVRVGGWVSSRKSQGN